MTALHASTHNAGPHPKRQSMSLGMWLALALAGVLLLVVANVAVLKHLQTSRLGLVEMVNELGKLRYLSQAVIQHEFRMQAGKQEDRHEIVELLQEGEQQSAWLQQKLSGFGSLPDPHDADIRDQWQTLHGQWLLFHDHARQLAADMLAEQGSPAQLDLLHREAHDLLEHTNRLTTAIVQAEDRFTVADDRMVMAILGLELLMALWVFGQFYKRVRRPLEEFSLVVRQFAQGDYDARVTMTDLKGEVRELAEAMNTTAGVVQKLLLQNEQHLRQSTLLHRAVQLLQPSSTPESEVLAQLVAILPTGWPRPEDTHACLYIGEQRYSSPTWQEGLAKGLRADITQKYGPSLTMEIRGEWLPGNAAGEGEQTLLQSVVEMVRGYLDNQQESTLRTRLASIVEATSDFASNATPDGRVLYCNPSLRQMANLTDNDIPENHNIAEFHPPWAMRLILEEGLPSAARDGIWHGESAVIDRHGQELPVSQVIVAHRTANGTIDYYSTLMRDISQHKEMERRLTESRDYYLRLFEEFPYPIWRVDTAAQCNYVNTAWLRFTGKTLEQELGNGWTTGIHADDLTTCMRTFLEAFRQHECFELTYRHLNAMGEYRWMADHGAPFYQQDGAFGGYIGICMDITERKHYEQQLEHQANHDELTGLPNRNLLQDRLTQAIAHARRHDTMVAVMFLDLDRFKTINDSLGHSAGDRLIQAVGQRLSTSLREWDTVARRGGDEFVLVIPALASEENAATVARKLFLDLAAPFDCGQREVVVTGSLGIALYPRDGGDAEILLRNADAALYRAKAAGRETFSFYTADLNARALEHLSLEQELRLALERQEFLLYYQPQVNLANGRFTGMEALVRWQHPSRGLVMPGTFIPLMEESGLITQLGRWVMNAACAQLAAWQKQGLPLFRMAVNVSARQFRQDDLVALVRETLSQHQLNGELLEIEMTETLMVTNPEDAAKVLRAIRQQGVEVAVDDFGIGYSSLGYLRRFPLNKIKIDQSFVQLVASDAESAAIVRTIIDLAHNLRLRVLAEGVETEEQRGFLRQNHCDEVQGYLFSKPLPAQELAELLRLEKPLLEYESSQEEPRTLLMLDDESSILDGLARVLRREGYRLLVTTDPDEAMSLLARHRVGVVLSDQRMPKITGVAFLRRVKEIYPETVRMILSGHADVQSVTDAINKGAIYKFLTKPYEPTQLKATLEEAFRVYETTRQSGQSALSGQNASRQGVSAS